MNKRRTKLIMIFCLLAACLTIVHGCDLKNKPEEIQGSFDAFINEIFIEEVQSDTLSLNYSLANPEKFGIKSNETTLGEYTVEEMKKDLSLSENYLKRLQEYDYEVLKTEQQLTFDITKSYLEQEIELGNYLYYFECLGPTTGLQAQLPILLAEYNFYDRDDIDQYLELLPCVYDYFKDIAKFEKEKSDRGLFMEDAVADRIIEQCSAFIENPEKNYLIEYFNEKINAFNGLTEKEAENYKKRNREAVMGYIIPSYELLIRTLKELKGTGTNRAGLYYYPEGQAYYECLARIKTGTDKSMEEVIKMLEAGIGDGILTVTKLTLSDADILNKFEAFTSFPLTDPEAILNDLKKDITKDFPEAVPVDCKIKYVHESLAEYLSPAMYLMPAIDNYTNNNIYINGNDSETLSTIYTTVAHEGYPGHLYQNVYFRSQNPAPIRNVMDFLGYDEGWATYVEFYSYHIAGIDDSLADLLEANNAVVLFMYARADIGIHYEGWKKSQAVSYIRNFVGDEPIAEKIYQTLLEEPAIYLPYAVGYLEILELRNVAEKELGNEFVAKDFHQFLLDIGPAQFGIIEDYMDVWIGRDLHVASELE